MNELVTICDRFEKLKHSSAAMCAFTEQGIAMLSSVLRSAIAVQVSIRIMDAFVAMRRALASMVPLQTRLEAVERRQIADQSRNEERFEQIFALGRRIPLLESEDDFFRVTLPNLLYGFTDAQLVAKVDGHTLQVTPPPPSYPYSHPYSHPYSRRRGGTPFDSSVEAWCAGAIGG